MVTMLRAVPNVTVTDDDRDADLAWAVAAFHEKPNTLYAKYRQYIEGRHPMLFATEKFEKAFGDVFKEFAYNLCESIVDAHADRLQIAGFGSNSDAIGTAAETLWEQNNMDQREGQVEAEMFGMGDGYVIVDQTPDGKPAIWPQLATEMRVRYSDEVPGDVETAARLWAEPGGPWRLNVYTKTEIRKYSAERNSGDTSIPEKADVFGPLETGEAWPLQNPVPGVVPVFHFGHNARVNDYGASVLRNVLALQDALNKTLTDEVIAAEFTAVSQKLLLGVAIDPNDTEAQERLQKFQAGVMNILTVDSVDGKTPSVAEFSAGNLEQFERIIEGYEHRISKVTKVPTHYFGIRGADFQSGAAMRMAESPFIALIERAQQQTGAVWSQVVEYALALSDVSVVPGDVRVNWKPAAPVSDEERIDRILARRQAGFPFVSAIREEGYDPDQIAKIEEEQAAERDANRQAFDAGFMPEA